MAKKTYPTQDRIGAHREQMLATGHVLVDATLRLEAHTNLQRIALRTGLQPRVVVDRLLRHPQARELIEAYGG